jgi:hypothetical protein
MVRETFNRKGLIRALSSQFKNVPQAVFELVDNSVDARLSNRPLSIWVTHEKDSITVLDVGGRGMGRKGLEDLLQWGGGAVHQSGDIGEYHVGGKAAIAYLGNDLRIRTKAIHEDEAVELLYKNFASSESSDDQQESVFTGKRPFGSTPDTGWTEIQISNLNVGRYRFDGLQARIADTYRTLLTPRDDAGGKSLSIFVRGEEVQSLDLPLAREPEKIELNEKLDKLGKVRGWAGRLDRERLTSATRVAPGLRLIYNGRLIEDEQFFRWESSKTQGRFGSLIGEIEVGKRPEGLQVRPDKSAFLHDNEAWDMFYKRVNAWLEPLMSALIKLHEEKPITKDEKRSLSEVLRELEQFLQEELKERERDQQQLSAPEGRKRPDEEADHSSASGERPERKEPKPRTPPPDDPVGSLERLRKLLGKGLPRVKITTLDVAVRAAGPNPEQEVPEILINNKFVLYPSAGDTRRKTYYAETVLRQVLMSQDHGEAAVGGFVARHDDLVARFVKRLDVSLS